MAYRVITATLTARTAVHIGSGADNDLTDALIRRDAEGQPFIPGTAIAGALRALLTRLAPRLWANKPPCGALTGSKASCSCLVCHLFGDINPSDEEGSQSAASRVVVFNATLMGDSPRAFIRDGVGIDRVTGAAARAGAVKFDLEVLPAGAAFQLRIELRDMDPHAEALLAAGLAEWQEGRLWLGGNVARGLGAFGLSDLEYRILPLDSPDHLLAFLKDDQPWQQAYVQPNWLSQQLETLRPVPANGLPKTVARGWFMLTGTLQAQGPLLTNDTMVSGTAGFDHAPLFVQWDDWQHPVLTGAGLRGVLRSHAERIARTLATFQAWDSAQGSEQRKLLFLSRCPACSPVESRKDAPLTSCDALLKGQIPSSEIVDDKHLCLACRLFGSTRQGSRLVVEDAPYAGEHPPTLKMLDFLAVDRFTGGGAEGAKFDALALWKPAFTLRLYLENPEEWELGWLALVLRDLEDGWLSVGFGAAKGLGRVKLENWTATFGYLTPEDAPQGVVSASMPPQRSGIYAVTHTEPATWQSIAKPWVEAFHRQVEDLIRPEVLRLGDDSYFGRVDHLYPVLKGGA